MGYSFWITDIAWYERAGQGKTGEGEGRGGQRRVQEGRARGASGGKRRTGEGSV